MNRWVRPEPSRDGSPSGAEARVRTPAVATRLAASVNCGSGRALPRQAKCADCPRTSGQRGVKACVGPDAPVSRGLQRPLIAFPAVPEGFSLLLVVVLVLA